MPRTTAILMLGLALASSVGAAKRRITAKSLQDCDRMRRAQPKLLDAYRCYFAVAQRFKKMKEARRHLEGLLRKKPNEPRAQLYLAMIRIEEGQQGGARLIRVAADGLHAQGEFRGEVYARSTLSGVLASLGKYDQATEQLARAAKAAAATKKRSLIALVHLARGYIRWRTGPAELAIKESLEALAAMDKLRGLQPTPWWTRSSPSARAWSSLPGRPGKTAFSSFAR